MDSSVALFLTTSSGLPRDREVDRVDWQDTYVNQVKLKGKNLDVVHIGLPAASIVELRRISNYYRPANPRFVVLQAGLVDCAPRALSQFEFEVIKRLRMFRFVKPFTKALRKYRKICYTKPYHFSEALVGIKEAFPNAILIGCGILPARPAYEEKVPGVTARIAQFNALLSQHTNFIDNSDFPDSGIAADHHHMTVAGNQILAERILKRIEQLSSYQ